MRGNSIAEIELFFLSMCRGKEKHNHLTTFFQAWEHLWVYKIIVFIFKSVSVKKQTNKKTTNCGTSKMMAQQYPMSRNCICSVSLREWRASQEGRIQWTHCSLSGIPQQAVLVLFFHIEYMKLVLSVHTESREITNYCLDKADLVYIYEWTQPSMDFLIEWCWHQLCLGSLQTVTTAVKNLLQISPVSLGILLFTRNIKWVQAGGT